MYVAPPLNPQQVIAPNTASGSVDFSIDGYSHADASWKFNLLWFSPPLTSFAMDGADLHIYGSSASTLQIATAAVALQVGADTTARVVNVTNNIFFDDDMFEDTGGTTNYAGANTASLIFGNNAAFAGNFYGNLTLTNPAMYLTFRGGSPFDIYGQIHVPTNVYVDPVYGPNYAMEVAKSQTGAAPITFYNNGNVWSNL